MYTQTSYPLSELISSQDKEKLQQYYENENYKNSIANIITLQNNDKLLAYKKQLEIKQKREKNKKRECSRLGIQTKIQEAKKRIENTRKYNQYTMDLELWEVIVDVIQEYTNKKNKHFAITRLDNIIYDACADYYRKENNMTEVEKKEYLIKEIGIIQYKKGSSTKQKGQLSTPGKEIEKEQIQKLYIEQAKRKYKLTSLQKLSQKYKSLLSKSLHV